jgi:hypothetical protein
MTDDVKSETHWNQWADDNGISRGDMEDFWEFTDEAAARFADHLKREMRPYGLTGDQMRSFAKCWERFGLFADVIDWDEDPEPEPECPGFPSDMTEEEIAEYRALIGRSWGRCEENALAAIRAVRQAGARS